MSRNGAITIGGGATCSNNLNLANGSTYSGSVNIVTAATTGGTVNIATGTGVTQTTVVNISSGTTTGEVTIGNTSSNINLNGSVTLSKPLILGTVPTVNTQLGFLVSGSISYNIITPSTSLVLSTPTTPIPSGLTINIQTITLTAGSWLLLAQGRLAVKSVPSATTITFAQPYPLRYNITSASQVYANAETYLEYSNLTFLSSIDVLPYSNFSVYVQPIVSTDYYLTVSPQYGNGVLTTGGTNLQFGTGMTLKAVRIA